MCFFHHLSRACGTCAQGHQCWMVFESWMVFLHFESSWDSPQSVSILQPFLWQCLFRDSRWACEWHGLFIVHVREIRSSVLGMSAWAKALIRVQLSANGWECYWCSIITLSRLHYMTYLGQWSCPIYLLLIINFTIGMLVDVCIMLNYICSALVNEAAHDKGQ